MEYIFFFYQKHIHTYDFDKYLSRSDIFMNILVKRAPSNS